MVVNALILVKFQGWDMPTSTGPIQLTHLAGEILFCLLSFFFTPPTALRIAAPGANALAPAETAKAKVSTIKPFFIILDRLLPYVKIVTRCVLVENEELLLRIFNPKRRSDPFQSFTLTDVWFLGVPVL